MATYAGRYDEPLLKYVSGRLRPATSATVTVYLSDGETLAPLYADRVKSSTVDNPVSPDALGNLEFFADPGTYVLSISEDGIAVATDTIVVGKDPDEVSGSVDTQKLIEWTAGGAFEMTAITYDATYTSVISTATVEWPDGVAGAFTTTDINETWEAIDAFTVTHAGTGSTITQPAVTRNAAGLVTAKPELIVS